MPMKIKNKRILLTGASGFIGSWVLDKLLDENCLVRVLLRNPDAVLTDDHRIERHYGDLLQVSSLQGIEKNIDTVIHCAGMLGKWGDEDTLLYQTNVQGSLNLMAQFSEHALEKFIYLSAGGVTGPVSGIANENSVCTPVTAYEKSKWEAEKALSRYSGEHDLPFLIVRPTFTYGPTDRHKFPLFKAVKKRRFAFIDSGSSLLSPVYITDLVNGLLLALIKGKNGETYIISGEEPVSKQQLIYCIADELKVLRPNIKLPYTLAWNMAIIMEALAKVLNFQPIITRAKVMMMGDDFAYSCDKARKDLGYIPQIPLAQGIHNSIEFYQNEGWFNND